MPVVPTTPRWNFSLAPGFFSWAESRPDQNPKAPTAALVCRNRLRVIRFAMIALLGWRGGMTAIILAREVDENDVSENTRLLRCQVTILGATGSVLELLFAQVRYQPGA